MAKERNLPSKTTLTTSDYIRVVGSDNASYKQNVNNVNRTIPITMTVGLTTEALIDEAYITAHNETPDATPYRRLMNHGMQHSIMGGGRYYLEGYRESANYGWQKVTSYGNPTKMYNRSLNNGTWTTWVQVPTRAEIDELNSKFITTECRGNSSFDLPIENDKHYLITMMTSSATSARVILISRRDTFVELTELGAGSWQTYFTETLSNNTWHITCNYYTTIKIVVL